MKLKNIKRIAAALLAGVMTLSMSAGVMAEGEPTQNLTITQTIVKDEGVVILPDMSYSYTIYPDGSDPSVDTLDAPEGGVTFKGGVTEAELITPSDEHDLLFETKKVLGTLDLELHTEAFSEAGCYRYTVNGPDGDMHFYIWINNGGEATSYYFADPETGEKNEGEFISTYTGTNQLEAFTVVAGDYGNVSDSFTYQITVFTEDENSDNLWYISGPEGDMIVSAGEEVEFTASHNRGITIHGLSATDTCSIVPVGKDGYEVTANLYRGDDRENPEEIGDRFDGGIEEYTYIDFIHTSNIAPPTGIVMDIAPYVLMVAAAAALAFAFLRRRSYSR